MTRPLCVPEPRWDRIALRSAVLLAGLVGWILPFVASASEIGLPARISLDSFIQSDGNDLGDFPALSADASNVAVVHRPDFAAVVLDVFAVIDSANIKRMRLLETVESTINLRASAKRRLELRVSEVNEYLEGRGYLTMQPLFFQPHPHKPLNEFLNWGQRVTWESETNTLTVGQARPKAVVMSAEDIDHPFAASRYETEVVAFTQRWPMQVRRPTESHPAGCSARPMPVSGWINLDRPPERPSVMVLRIIFQPLEQDCHFPDEWLVAPL